MAPSWSLLWLRNVYLHRGTGLTMRMFLQSLVWWEYLLRTWREQ